MATYQSVTTGDVIVVRPHVDRAERTLAAARVLLREGFATDAVVRAHQSTVHAERALLATERRSPHDARAVHRLATLHFHQPLQVDPVHLERIEGLAAARARFDDQAGGEVSDEDASTGIDHAAAFLADVRAWLDADGYLDGEERVT